jgi:hypothetical protein
MPSYSFGPADPSLDLPALWRCPCGFQLDGGVQLGDGLQFGGFPLEGIEQGVDQGAAGLAAAC